LSPSLSRSLAALEALQASKTLKMEAFHSQISP
jgi:hypothetical protein